MTFERRKLQDLRPAEYNPRKRLTPSDPEYQQIKRSILEFGYADPIVINYDGTIIKGHQRCNVMLDLGITEADVVVLTITDKAKERALNVALNKITGIWDESLLKDLLQELDLEGYDFTSTGFEREDLQDLIQLTDVPAEAQPDDFDPDAAAEEIKKPISEPGTIWHLGRHRLLCGDATNHKDIDRLLQGRYMDLIITDPPYNVDYGDKHDKAAGNMFRNKDRGDNNHIDNDRMKNREFYNFLLTAFRNICDALRPGGVFYVFHADMSGIEFRTAIRDSGLLWKQTLIWEKNVFVLGRQDYQWRHEPVLYGWRDGAAHYFVKDRTQDTVLLDDPPDFRNMKKQELLAFIENLIRESKDTTTVQYEDKPAKSPLHPTMKPVPLVGRFINNSSRPGQAVGDFFAGSGTTLIAAEQLGRTAYCIEKEPIYTDVIVRRWEEYTGEKAVRE